MSSEFDGIGGAPEILQARLKGQLGKSPEDIAAENAAADAAQAATEQKIEAGGNIALNPPVSTPDAPPVKTEDPPAPSGDGSQPIDQFPDADIEAVAKTQGIEVAKPFDRAAVIAALQAKGIERLIPPKS